MRETSPSSKTQEKGEHTAHQGKSSRAASAGPWGNPCSLESRAHQKEEALRSLVARTILEVSSRWCEVAWHRGCTGLPGAAFWPLHGDR